MKKIYLFRIWDCNDETRMKLVRTIKISCEPKEEEVAKQAKQFLKDTEKIESTGWVEIWEFWGVSN